MVRRYEYEVLERAPLILPARVYVFPKQVEEVERGALRVMVRDRAGEAWMGVFALGYDSPHVLTGVWETGHPERLVAVSGGYGYLVDVGSPDRTVKLELEPLVACVESAGWLLFAGYRRVIAVRDGEVAWVSEAVSAEGITGLRVEGAWVRGTGWDAVTDKERGFEIELATGRVVLS